jgi:hypothetical protein
MVNWTYTLTKGKTLHEAINAEDEQLVVKCLLACYKELYDKLTDEDKEWRGMDIEDNIETLTYAGLDDDDDIDDYLDEFYSLCDELRAWITL